MQERTCGWLFAIGEEPPSTEGAGCMHMRVFERLRQWAHAVKRDVLMLYLAARDPRVPWYAKVVAGCVAAYALSPIDLIPDFIPVLGLPGATSGKCTVRAS